mmetsp:Transcript_31871/g.62745  ORF Transcript_31871/g.62745 Transcript_31871/m.62745 type:complete len:234 (+) Transcript_31871:83-784(+)
MVHLSFNPLITPPEELGDDHGDDAPAVPGTELPETLPLRHRWIVWEQLMASGSKAIQYSESTRQIASCETVEEFWRTWVQLPQPSEMLTQRMVLNVADGFHIIDALMVFREGIAPQWEDAANADGGHLQFQFRASVGGGQLDEHWNNLVLGIVGGTIEPADMITGVRLVDKLSAGRGQGNLRMEVWFSNNKDPQAIQTLQWNVERCMGTRMLEGRIGTVPKAEIKSHRLTRHQ